MLQRLYDAEVAVNAVLSRPIRPLLVLGLEPRMQVGSRDIHTSVRSMQVVNLYGCRQVQK